MFQHVQISDDDILMDSSADSIRDFMRVREAYFALASTELRTAASQGAYSVQEKIVSVLLGTIVMPTGEEIPTISLLDLLDFLDVETNQPVVLSKSRYFDDDNLSSCTKDDPETGIGVVVEAAGQGTFSIERKDSTLPVSFVSG